MPTGNVPLVTAAKYGKDKTAPGVVEVMIRESPQLEMLPWISFEGNALQKEVEGTLPSVEFRQVNAGYSDSYGSNDMEYWGVAILGGQYKVDKFLTNVVANAKDLEAEQIAKMAKANAMRFDYEFLHGDGTANGFRGLDALIDTHGQTYDNNGSPGPFSFGGFDEAVAKFRNTGGPDAILADRLVQVRITQGARNSGNGFHLLDVTRDAFDRQVWSLSGVPIRVIGDVIDRQGAVVKGLPFTESSDTTSAWLVKYSKDDVCGLMGLGGSFEVQRFGELESAPQRMGRMEWYPGIGVFSRYSLVRYSNITDAAATL